MPKHQLRPQGDFPTAGLIRRLAALFYDFLLCVALIMVVTLISVSYTHLDVYKRQAEVTVDQQAFAHLLRDTRVDRRGGGIIEVNGQFHWVSPIRQTPCSLDGLSLIHI